MILVNFVIKKHHWIEKVLLWINVSNGIKNEWLILIAIPFFFQVFEELGNNKKLGLTGRPKRPLGALGTSKVRYVFFLQVLFWFTYWFLSFASWNKLFQTLFFCSCETIWLNLKDFKLEISSLLSFS